MVENPDKYFQCKTLVLIVSSILKYLAQKPYQSPETLPENCDGIRTRRQNRVNRKKMN